LPAGARSAAAPSAEPFILVVDDEEPLLRIVNVVLSKAGFRVRTASDGVQALEIFRQAPDDVSAVILDLSMPGLSGEEVLAEIHQIRPGAPVILASGYSEQEATGNIRPGELAGFIKKPYRLDALAHKISSVLSTPKAD
jgi:DNA-binding NtrC family response regulator